MAKKNQHHRSYGEQARNSVKARIKGWKKFGIEYGMDFSEIITDACSAYRRNIVKYRIIKGLRRYGKRKGLI